MFVKRGVPSPKNILWLVRVVSALQLPCSILAPTIRADVLTKMVVNVYPATTVFWLQLKGDFSEWKDR